VPKRQQPDAADREIDEFRSVPSHEASKPVRECWTIWCSI